VLLRQPGPERPDLAGQGPEAGPAPKQLIDLPHERPGTCQVGEREGLKPFIVIAYDGERRPLLLLPLALSHRYGVRIARFMGGKHATFNMALWDRDFAATATLADLDAFVRKEIAGYKVPRSLWLVDEIKRSPAGKPDYRWAKEQTEARPADDVHSAHVTA